MQILSQSQFLIKNYKQISVSNFFTEQEFLIFSIPNYFISAELFSLQNISYNIFFSKPFYRKKPPWLSIELPYITLFSILKGISGDITISTFKPLNMYSFISTDVSISMECLLLDNLIFYIVLTVFAIYTILAPLLTAINVLHNHYHKHYPFVYTSYQQSDGLYNLNQSNRLTYKPPWLSPHILIENIPFLILTHE